LFKLYFASRLDLPHYQVPVESLEFYVNSISESYTDMKWEIYNDCTKNYRGDFLNVINKPSRKIASTFQKLPLDDIAEFVLKSGSSDGQRKNKFCDVGFASDQNTGRSVESNGISKPRVLEHSCNPLLATAAAALSSVIDNIVPSRLRFKAYRDEKRQKEFADTLSPGNLFEAIRFALTNEDHILDIHEDSSNDPDILFSGVATFSKWLPLSDGKWWRLSIIGYSRRSVPRYLSRKSKYNDIINKVVAFAHSLPQDRLVISQSLLHFPSNSKASMHHLSPHCNKCVYLSAYADCIEQLRTAFDLTIWHMLALIYNVVDSESPIYFRKVTESLLTMASSKKYCKELHLDQPAEFGVVFYNLLWDLKDRKTASGNKHRVPGQRHQPHNNIRQPNFVVNISIQNLFRVYLGVKGLHPKQLGDCHYFGRTVSRLEESFEKGGAYGAGPLTAQHITGVSCLLGIFPLSFLDHAEIGQSTASYKYLKREYGLIDHMEDTRQILEALSTVLGSSFFICENLVCKWVQSKRKTEAGAEIACPYTDTIFKHQVILYKSGTNLFLVTSKGHAELERTSADKCKVNPAMDKAMNKEHLAFAADLWNVRYQAGRKLFPMKSSTRRVERLGNGKRKTTVSMVSTRAPTRKNKVTTLPVPVLTTKAVSRLRVTRNLKLSQFSSFYAERKSFSLPRFSKQALNAQFSRRTKFVSYERYSLGGYIFFRAWLRVGDDTEDTWAPTSGAFNFYPKSNSITVSGYRYYPTKREAQQYSMFCAVFQKNHSFFRENILGGFLPEEKLRKEDQEYSLEPISLRVSHFLAFYDPDAVGEEEKKAHATFLGLVKYGDGAVGARLLETNGQWMKGSVMHYI
jgi:hypothetical protein